MSANNPPYRFDTFLCEFPQRDSSTITADTYV